MSQIFSKGQAMPATPEPPPVPPLALQSDKRPQKKPQQPSFLADTTTPGGVVGAPSGAGGKTLLGQ
jgi:hypothetical protein